MKVVVSAFALLTILPLLVPATVAGADEPTVPMPSSLSPLTPLVRDQGVASLDQPVRVVVGLDLHDKAKLDAFLADVSDPRSPDFQRFLTQDEFNARYGPTAAQEARVVSWLADAGFHVTQRFPNRLLVVAEGTNAAAQAAFGVPVHRVLFQSAPHLAVLDAPRFPADVAAFATGVFGLDDLVQMQPMGQPAAKVGSSCCAFSPADLARFYGNGYASVYNGSGQTVVIAGAYSWKDSDNNASNSQWSLPSLPAGSAQVCVGSGAGCGFDSSQSLEVSLDVQMVHAVAPGAAVKNYMAQTTAIADFPAMYNQIVTDNPGHVVSTSWGHCEPNSAASFQSTDDNIFSNGNAVGQSWFAATGDHGSNDCNALLTGTVTVDHPANAPHMMGVGGTHANCSPAMTVSAPNCTAYGSETAWSGAGGGASVNFAKPSYQTGCGVPADGQRDVPDLSMEADTSPGNWVVFNGTWNVVGGTSDAAPQWGAYFALLNQRIGGSGVGLPGTRLYQLCGGSSYHDVTSGSNGAFSAGAGYDQVTGLGTIDADWFLVNWGNGSAIAPSAPRGLVATAGDSQVSLSWTAAPDGASAVTNYTIYRGTTSGGETQVAVVGNVTTYTDTGLTDSQTYYYKVDATNAVGEGPNSTEASATPTAIVFNETFDASTSAPANWTFSGLWHVTSACQGAASPANSLQYTQDSTCTYDTGATNTGDATTPAINLSGLTLPLLRFSTKYQVEHFTVGGFDKLQVQVLPAGSTTWSTIWVQDSSTAAQTSWTTVTLSLNLYKSAGTQVRFHFDTVTPLNNGFPGWAVDNVTMLGGG